MERGIIHFEGKCKLFVKERKYLEKESVEMKKNG